MIPPIGLSLSDYLSWVYQKRESLESWSHWSSPLFHFLRWAKAHLALKHATAGYAFQAVESVLRGWSKLKKRECPWKVWFEIDRIYAKTHFLDIWDKIRYLPGESPLEGAWERTQACPMVLRDEVLNARESEAYPRFVSLAGWLQVMMGDQDILLPVEKVGKVMGLDPSCISIFRRWAKNDGYLKEEKKSVRKVKATRFRFNVSRFPMLRELAQSGTQVNFDVVKNIAETQTQEGDV
jgi:hypothetical protein